MPEHRRRASTSSRGWETDGLDPHSWQRAQPLSRAARRRGASRASSCRKAEYAGTGFTERDRCAAPSSSRVADVAERVEHRRRPRRTASRRARLRLRCPSSTRSGTSTAGSPTSGSAALERVDAAARALGDALARRRRARSSPPITAWSTCPRHRHVLLGEGDALLDGVRHHRR